MNRNEIETLAVGDSLSSTLDIEPFSRFTKLKENARFDEPKKIVRINVRKEDVNGKLFVIGETEFGPNSTISFSIKEGELLYKKV